MKILHHLLLVSSLLLCSSVRNTTADPHVAPKEITTSVVDKAPIPISAVTTSEQNSVLAVAPVYESVLIQVVYSTIDTLLTEYHVHVLERLSRDFLRLRGNLDVETLSVTHQELTSAAAAQLVVHLSIAGFGVSEAVNALNSDWNDYLAFLRIGLEDVFVDDDDADAVVTIGGNSDNGDKDWRLLGAAMSLSILAVMTVGVVRWTAQRRFKLWYKGRQYIRDASLNDGSSSLQDTQDHADSVCDIHRPVGQVLTRVERALSEESDGGWISALSSVNGGTTLSSIHENDYDYDYGDDDDVMEDVGLEDEGAVVGVDLHALVEEGLTEVAEEEEEDETEEEEEGWAVRSSRKVKGVLIYV